MWLCIFTSNKWSRSQQGVQLHRSQQVSNDVLYANYVLHKVGFVKFIKWLSYTQYSITYILTATAFNVKVFWLFDVLGFLMDYITILDEVTGFSTQSKIV